MNLITSIVVVILVTSYCLVESLPQYPQGQVGDYFQGYSGYLRAISGLSQGYLRAISGIVRVAQVYSLRTQGHGKSR